MEIECDIILLSWNNLDILRNCVETLLQSTHTPSRLLIVDNGSTENGLREYLAALKGNQTVRIELIINAVNEGFARGMNAGIRASHAPYLCLINNDLIFTDGWLEEMIKVAAGNPKIGVVNPSSNNFGLRPALSGERAGLRPCKDSPIGDFARALRRDSGKWIEMNAAVGFCMLIKKEVIEKAGYLDEGYGYAYFEDTDFSRKAQKAGYICAMAKASYVYHLERCSAGFLNNSDAHFRRSAVIFHERWGRPMRVVYAVIGGSEELFGRVKRGVEDEIKEHNRIWVFQKEGIAIPCLPEHLDVMRQFFPGNFFAFTVLWNIFKKKKRFDKVYTDNDFLRSILSVYGLFRGSKIMRI